MVYANLISGSLCAFSGPRLTSLSDIYGRKPLIALSASGIFLGDVVSLLAASFPNVISVRWIYLEFVFGGLTGAFVTTTALVQLYVADSTCMNQRTNSFNILHACMYLGLGFGPLAGAWFVENVGRRDMLSIFYIAGICHLAFICYTGILIPESQVVIRDSDLPTKSPKIAHKDPKPRQLLRECNLLEPFKIFKSRAGNQPRYTKNLVTLAVIDALAFGVHVGLPVVSILYSEYRFQWTNYQINMFLTITNLSRATILAILLPLLVRLTKSSKSGNRVGLQIGDSKHPLHDRRKDIVIIRVSLLVELFGQMGFLSSKSSLSFGFSSVLTAAGSPISPVAQSLMTSLVEPNTWGSLFGSISLLHSITRAFIPAMMHLVYSSTVQCMSYFVFGMLSAIFGFLFFTSLLVDVRPGVI